MKISALALIFTANAQETVTIGSKEKQKINHLKKNWPKMIDLYFVNPEIPARRPESAARFGNLMKTKMERVSRILWFLTLAELSLFISVTLYNTVESLYKATYIRHYSYGK